jgi:hypothetical protein
MSILGKRIGKVIEAVIGLRFGLKFESPLRRKQSNTKTLGVFSEFCATYSHGPGLHKWKHYITYYDRKVSPLLVRDLRILEIGVQSGGSLRMWESVTTPETRIVGIDINPKCLEFSSVKSTVCIGSQVDREFLKGIVNQYGPFDIIVDDGSHWPEHQRLSLEYLFDSVACGGVYIIEDVHGRVNGFSSFMIPLILRLSEMRIKSEFSDCVSNSLQRYIDTIESGPFFFALWFRSETMEDVQDFKSGDYWIPYY